MEKYCPIKQVGVGAFGCVWQAVNKQSGEMVAIKKINQRCYSLENTREFKSLIKMNHPNIIKLKEVIMEHNTLYFVFEYMHFNLLQLGRKRKDPFSEDEVRNLCFQVLQGLHHMHRKGYFHRDLKPENLLVSGDIIKIADFGLAKEINSMQPHTQYVGTRWYQAPEVMLMSSTYTSKVDMWAIGAIMAELMTLRPLFPGASQVYELSIICCVLGTPTESSWADGLRLAKAINYEFPQVPGTGFSQLIPSASENAISLLSWLCSWDPCKRPTAAEALQHPFFQSCFPVPPSIHQSTVLTKHTPASSVKTRRGLSKVDEVSEENQMFGNMAIGPRRQSRAADDALAKVAIGPRRRLVAVNKLANVAIGPRRQSMAVV